MTKGLTRFYPFKRYLKDSVKQGFLSGFFSLLKAF
nr:MAG TPA: hypothetical protein [Caudoviricetes sp.]